MIKSTTMFIPDFKTFVNEKMSIISRINQETNGNARTVVIGQD